MRPAIIALLALALLGAGGAAATASAQAQPRCFPETGECISGAIRSYWERNGGLPIFGYPISPVRTEQVEGWRGPVQWFERDRLEDHSAEGQGVLAGRLGVERLAQLGQPWRYRPLPAVPAGCLGFPETGYSVCGSLRAYWERNGGLERFGYPVSDLSGEQIYGSTHQVQYFERRRMELHPDNAPPYDILLGLLGRELQLGGPPAAPSAAPAPSATPRPDPAPTPPPPTPAVAQQIFIDYPTDEVIVQSPFTVSGRTTRMPGGGRLSYIVEDDHGEDLGDGSFPVAGRPGGGADFVAEISFRPPAGKEIALVLRDVNPATGETQATARHEFDYNGPARVGRIVIESPRQGEFVSPDFDVRGYTSYMPEGGDLYVRVVGPGGGEISLTRVVVDADSDRPPAYALDLHLHNLGGRQVTIEVQDRDAAGKVLNQVAVQVYVATEGPLQRRA